MITRKIAKNGMKGRKKVSMLLILVLTFTFTFITTAVLLETSMQETQLRQRERLYGTWQAAYFGADSNTREMLLGESSVTDAVTSYLLGKDATCGNVGTINQDMVDMGNLVLKQGRLPEQPGEILLEESVADSLGIKGTGEEKITLTLDSILVSEDKEPYLREQLQNLYQEDENSAISGFRRHVIRQEKPQENLALTIDSEYSLLKEQGYTDPKEIEQNGLLYEQTLEITREYVVTGVVQSFSGFWDTGAFPVAEMFVAESEAKTLLSAIRQNTMKDLSDYSFSSNLFFRSDMLGESLCQSLEKTYITAEEQEAAGSKNIALRRNNYAYPAEGQNAEETLTMLVVLVIFIVTFCAILQIFLTQMKQRTRKIALLKSIGTTNRQVCAILSWEGVYLVLYSLPLGVLLGFGGGYGTVQFMNRAMGMDLSFYAKPLLILGGILAGCMALFAGMLIPVVKALRVPLVGTISVTTAKHKKSVRQQLGNGKRRKGCLTYEQITRIHNRLNWKNVFLTSVITFASCMLVFGSLYLGYEAFSNYHEKVVAANRPNYELSAPHGYTHSDMGAFAEALKKTNPKAEMAAYHKLTKVYLKYDGMEESPLLSKYKELLPQENYSDYIGTKPSTEEQVLMGVDPDNYEFLEGTIGTSIYTVDTDDEVCDMIFDMITDGEVDENAFLRGENVILAIPMYRKTGNEVSEENRKLPDTVTEDSVFDYVMENLGGFEFTYDKSLEQTYHKDTSIKPGDELYLFKQIEPMDGAPVYNFVDTKVGGIIYYTAEDAVYPFLSKNCGFTIIGSNQFLSILSSSAGYNPLKVLDDYNANQAQFVFLKALMPTAMGETHINIYTEDGANSIEPAAQIAKLGKDYGLTFSNYNEENWNLYYRALNNSLILGILGGTSLLIALMILWNIQMSAFEQERKRIGVLQALGVTNRKIAAAYWKNGIKNALMSLFFTHILLFGILYLAKGGMLYLKYYPWVAHIAICVLFLSLTVFVYSGPAKELKKYAPTENIAS